MSTARRRARLRREVEEEAAPPAASWIPPRPEWEVVAAIHLPDGDNARGRRELFAAHPELLRLPPEDLRVDITCGGGPEGRLSSGLTVSRRVRGAPRR